MIGGKLLGVPDLRRELAALVPKLKVRAIMNALRAGGRVVQKAEREAIPKLATSDRAVIAGRRTSGLLRKAVSVRTSKVAKRRGDLGVFVNVRPAKGAARGAKSPKDPFYWRFVAFGTKFMGKRDFTKAGAQSLGRALTAFNKALLPAIEKLNKPKAPPP